MKKGFTLLEISIVMAIIGLIVGGIMVGKDLVRNAELTSVITDIEKYRVATKSFKEKYNSLPGDMSDAQSYWASCVDNGANTCNGDDSGIISGSYEPIRFWQHLSLAELIDETYQGNQTAGLSNEDNYPFILNNILSALYLSNYQDKTDTVVTFNKHLFSQAGGTDIDELSMAQLDTKYDDGKPESGNIMMYINDGSGSDCLTNTSPADYDYTASGDYNECYPAFLMGID